MADLIYFAATAAAVMLVFGQMVPRIARSLASMSLRQLRDRAYALAGRYPALTRTNVYRDVEYLLSWSIHTVEERPFSEAVMMFIVWHPHGAYVLPPSHEMQERLRAEYERDQEVLRASEVPQDAMRDLVDIIGASSAAIAPVFFVRPWVGAFFLCLAVVERLRTLVSAAPPEPKPHPAESPTDALVHEVAVRLSPQPRPSRPSRIPLAA